MLTHDQIGYSQDLAQVKQYAHDLLTTLGEYETRLKESRKAQLDLERQLSEKDRSIRALGARSDGLWDELQRARQSREIARQASDQMSGLIDQYRAAAASEPVPCESELPTWKEIMDIEGDTAPKDWVWGLRTALDTMRYRLSLRETHLTPDAGGEYLGDLLAEAYLEVARAIEYRRHDMVCEGEGPDDDEAAVECGCPKCREEARKEVGVFGAILFALETTIEMVEGNLGKEIPHHLLVYTPADDLYDSFRDACEEAWERMIVGATFYWNRKDES